MDHPGPVPGRSSSGIGGLFYRTGTRVFDEGALQTEPERFEGSLKREGNGDSWGGKPTEGGAVAGGMGLGNKGEAEGRVPGAHPGYPIEVSHLSYGVVVDTWMSKPMRRLLNLKPAAPQSVSAPPEDDSLPDPAGTCIAVDGEGDEGGARGLGVGEREREGNVLHLPVARVSAWSQLSGSFRKAVLPAGQVKTILRDVSFTAHPGELMAVVGSSGAGKSTVLDALAGRIRPSSLQGQILVNGQPTGSKSYKRLIGYVMQDEALFAMLTPRETLMLSACLRLPTTISKRDKAERVEGLLASLGLMGVADSRIGDADTRGISGGEKRRVSIGIDLVHDPPVLFLDEPTSGLDSSAALNVVEVLQGMASQQNRTIVLSIHQPSFRILELIDRILLLHKGAVAFCGSLPRLESSLEAMGFPAPLGMTALDYAIELLQETPDATMALFRKAKEEAGEAGALALSVHVEGSGEHAKSTKVNGDEGEKEEEEEEEDTTAGAWRAMDSGAQKQRTYATSFWNEVGALCHRNMMVMLRTKELCLVRVTQVALCALGLGTVFLHVGASDHSIQDRMGFLAFSMAFLLTSSMEALPLFLKERQVFLRETARGAYRLSSYQVASVLVFLPFQLLLAIVFSAGSYWLVGLYPSWQAFCFFTLTVWGALLAANSLVAATSALAPDFISANTMISGVMGGFFLFSGYFIARASIPVYWLWMYYLSLFKYPLEALLVNEYGNDPTMLYGFFTGEQVLTELDLASTNKWLQVAAVFGFAVFYRILCYYFLLFQGTSRS